jgi:HEAT repeat protein
MTGRLFGGYRPPESVLSAVRPGAAKPLIKALTRRDVALRQEAARMLNAVGPEAKDAVPALLLALRDKDDLLRRRAADALGRMGSDAVPPLLRVFVQGDDRAREAAARALGWHGGGAKKAAIQLRAALQEKQPAVQVQAALALWRIEGEVLRPVALLVEILGAPEGPARAEAAEALGLIGTDGQPAPPNLANALAKALKDADGKVRLQAVRALWRIDRQARVVVPLVRPALDDADSSARLLAVAVLGELGPEAKVMGPLTEALNDKEEQVRRAAVAALARNGLEAVPALTKALQHPSPAVRAGAAEALGWVGSSADGAVKPLLEAVGDSDDQVSKRAARAVYEIGPDGAEELIEKARKARKAEK